MNIQAVTFEQIGPGIDLSEQPRKKLKSEEGTEKCEEKSGNRKLSEEVNDAHCRQRYRAGGPGIDLSEQPAGIALTISDPVADFEYARNAVTLVYDLTGKSKV